jgi:hypothetical protein
MKSAFAIVALLALSSFTVEREVANWTYSFSQAAKEGSVVDLVFTATIKKNWYVYSSDLSIDIGPIPTQVELTPDPSYQLEGNLVPQNPLKKMDNVWGAQVTYFMQKAELRQTIKIIKANPTIRGTLSGQYCSTTDGQCIPFKEEFQF